MSDVRWDMEYGDLSTGRAEMGGYVLRVGARPGQASVGVTDWQVVQQNREVARGERATMASAKRAAETWVRQQAGEFDLGEARRLIRIKAREDAAAGRLLGTLPGVRNWLRLRNTPEGEVEDLMNIYSEEYDDAAGLEMTDES